MSKIVLDTGPLIALAITSLLPEMYRIVEGVYIPEKVYEEALIEPYKTGAKAISHAVKTKKIIVQSVLLNAEDMELSTLLDSGEVEALALAKKIKDVCVIDEKKGRRVGIQHNIPIVGTASLLIKAKQSGLIDTIAPLLELLSQHGYRLSQGLIQTVLKISGELL